jgi:hypothetical protein
MKGYGEISSLDVFNFGLSLGDGHVYERIDQIRIMFFLIPTSFLRMAMCRVWAG